MLAQRIIRQNLLQNGGIAVKRFIIALIGIVLINFFLAEGILGQGAKVVDIGALMDKIASDSTYNYRFISGEELNNFDQIWQLGIPYGIKRIERIGGGNFLVISRSNISKASCPITPKSREDEELISVVSRDGVLLNKASIGNRYLHAIYKSEYGKLISIVSSGYDDTAESKVIDENGDVYLTVDDAVLYPSSDGNYLVSRRAVRPSRIPWDNQVYFISSKSKINKSNLRKILNIIKGNGKETISNTNVLRVFDDDILLLSSRKNNSEFIHCLNLYEIGTGRLIWRLDNQNALSVIAVTRSEENEEYILLEYWLNEEKICNTIINKNNGSFIAKVINGEVWSAIGSSDGLFYGNVEGNLKNDHFRRLIIQFDPKFNVFHFGFIYRNNILENLGELEGFVWGVNKNVELEGRCYPFVTPIYDMRADLLKKDTTVERALLVNPVILEGVWVIDEVTEDSVVLVGQIDTKDGVLRKIRVDGALIGL